MKALKEKRVSLRTLWRKSLVIFFMVALAFVFASCGDDSGPADIPANGNGNGNGNGDDTPNVIDVTEPLAVEIIVRGSRFMSRVGHEGQIPDITGLRADVRFNDGVVRTVSMDELVTVPAVFSQTHTTINQRNFESQYSDATDNLTIIPLVPVRVFHRSSSIASDEIYFPLVLALETDPLIEVEGALAKQEFFEDNLEIDSFEGLEVTALYTPFNLPFDSTNDVAVRWVMPTTVDGVQGLRVWPATVSGVFGVTAAFTDFLDDLEDDFDDSDPAFKYGNPWREEILVTQDHLIAPFGGAFNRQDRTISLRFSEVDGSGVRDQDDFDVDVPFSRMYTVMHITLANTPDWSTVHIMEHLGDAQGQTTTAAEHAWWALRLQDAGVILRVHYAGTDQTRDIDMIDFRRAMSIYDYGSTRPRAGFVQSPVVSNARVDPDTVFARLYYYGGTGQANPGGDWFPNQVLNLNVPVWVFSGDIAWVDKDLRVNQFPLQWYHEDTNGPIPEGLMQAIFHRYNLVAYFERGNEPQREVILNDRFVNTQGVLLPAFVNAPGDATAGANGAFWFADGRDTTNAGTIAQNVVLQNAGVEPIEYEIRFRIPTFVAGDAAGTPAGEARLRMHNFVHFSGINVDGFEITILHDDGNP